MKRVFAVFLSCLLLIGILPVCVGAEEDTWPSSDEILAQIPNAPVTGMEGFDPKDYPFLSDAAGFGAGDRNYVENEPNDTASTADYIDNDYTVAGAISDSQDVDLFGFVLSEDGGISVVAASYVRSTTWAICDSNGNVLAVLEDQGSDDGVYADVIEGSLPAGTYYLLGCDVNGSVSEYMFYFESHTHIYSSRTDTTCNVCGHERTVSGAPDEPVTPGRTAIFRMYNPYTQEHLLTSDRAERDRLVRAGWSLDGTAWYAPTSGRPVFRLYNPFDDFHFYTTSQAEVNSLLPRGWRLDGPVSFSATAQNGVPVYRLFNPYALTNYHLFTSSVEERDWLAYLGWRVEGVAWYAVR